MNSALFSCCAKEKDEIKVPKDEINKMASQPKTKEKAKAGEKAEGEEKVETEEKTEHALSSCAKTKTFILEYFWVSMSRNWNENYKVVYYAALVFVLRVVPFCL